MRKPARQGSKLAAKGAYMDVSDRRLHVQLTQEAKIASDFSLFRAIFAFAGFVSALTRPRKSGRAVKDGSGKLQRIHAGKHRLQAGFIRSGEGKDIAARLAQIHPDLRLMKRHLQIHAHAAVIHIHDRMHGQRA